MANVSITPVIINSALPFFASGNMSFVSFQRNCNDKKRLTTWRFVGLCPEA